MMPVRYLLDTSAVVRMLHDRTVGLAWEQQRNAGLLAICPAIELELLYSARSKAHRATLLNLIDTVFGFIPMPDGAFEHAAEVQGAMTDRGTHRSAGVVDLLVAAAAELHQLTLVHNDHDFQRVAEVTGQPTVWVAPQGSVD